jgi:hypothetical protein
MGDFEGGVRHRVRQARESLRAALASGDEYAAQVYTAELEEMLRLARGHGITIGPEPGAER